MTSNRIQLLGTMLCPHCRHRFEPQRILSIARHPQLIGDRVAGKDAFLRFPASRFNAAGNAIDPMDAECTEFACPRCHLEVAHAALEVEPMFASIVGAPASGKSYFLTTMTWQLRQLLPRFGWTLTDADALANERIMASEQKLFQSSDKSAPVALEKTVLSGSDMYSTVTIDHATVTLPKPFQFIIRPLGSESLTRYVVLYDNAGEHFLPSRDSLTQPMTEHLAHSRVILFLLDPTQDPRLRALCHANDPQLRSGPRLRGFSSETVRQEAILTEMDSRIRRAKGMNARSGSKVPLIVVLSKADLLANQLGDALTSEPIRPTASGKPRLDISHIMRVNRVCRDLLKSTMPEFVAAAEQSSDHVIYVPASALGSSPELMDAPGGQMLGVRPENIKPSWVTVPFLCALQHLAPDEFPAFADSGEQGR